MNSRIALLLSVFLSSLLVVPPSHFRGIRALAGTNLSPSQTQNTTVSISLSKPVIATGQSAVLTWSAVGATSCQGGGNPFIQLWSNTAQPTSGSSTVTPSSAGTYVYALNCTGSGGTASASATLTVTDSGGTPAVTEAITSLPVDITPMLSVAGVWQPVADQYLRPDGNGIVVFNPGNARLPNGREGLVATGWSCCGADASKPITPVDIAIFEQQSDGNLQLATSKYVSDPQTNGGINVLAADFNNDGTQDIYLPAHNESPTLPASSTAYISQGNGTYAKVNVGDKVEAHGAALANLNGIPTVFTASYYIAPPPNSHGGTATQFGPAGFTTVQDIGTGGNSSVAVGDFYGDGKYSLVCGDCKYGPGFPFNTSDPNHFGIMLWHLSGLMVSGQPVSVGTPYFNGKPEYAGYPSFWDPFKTHTYRTWLDDFNHDGMLDIVNQASIWHLSHGTLKNVLQMFQNTGGYKFKDVTDALNPQYDKDSTETDYIPQVRDIDGSGVNTYLLASSSSSQTQAASNYLIVNDGSGNLQPALHETLNRYGRQAVAWVSSLPSFSHYYTPTTTQPVVRAYQTPDGKLNFAAFVWVRPLPKPNPPVERYVVVNIPLRLDLPGAFTKNMVVRDRNGSHLIRTFAGDDTIHSGNNGGHSKVDGGLGTNTAVYSGPSQNYSATHNADGTWTIKDNVGQDGTDTLTRIQRVQFTDRLVQLTTPTVEFGPGSFSVGEGGLQVNLTVTRSGATLGASTVDFATGDDAGSQDCGVFNGKASSRCDYLGAAGTLSFAAGETSKTISISIIDDSYAEGPESFKVSLSNPSGAALGAGGTTTVAITDNDSTTGANPINQAGFFVRQHYLDFLNRGPDSSGLAFWVNGIEVCGADAQCVEVKRIYVSAAFFLSIEFQQTGYMAYRARKAAFGNITGKPVPITREEMLADMQVVGSGVVVGGENWEQKLEQNKEAYFNQLASSARFVALYPQAMTPEAYVDALNQNAGGALSQAERDALVSELKGGAKTRAQVLRTVAEDSDLTKAESNKAFVLMQYFGYLRRDPDSAPDKDFSGYNFWLGKLNQFNGNFINAEMVKAFLSADEYRSRFGQ